MSIPLTLKTTQIHSNLRVIVFAVAARSSCAVVVWRIAEPARCPGGRGSPRRSGDPRLRTRIWHGISSQQEVNFIHTYKKMYVRMRVYTSMRQYNMPWYGMI